ncbi:unnamed protein product [Ranitomeya imitator]|uniref:Helix-turn-helix domain-containing protein n=1 Tax=Ranitomeya imitator TaxID=111125 RepID=A0ABN9M2K9_9NEOB|nr:unnamed protein product [Ranitomeya imitator]
MKFSSVAVQFLDLEVKCQNGKLSTCLYRKPTAVNSLLEYRSFHPKHTRDGIPRGQFLRARRNCTDDEDFRREAHDLTERFRRRNYPKKCISRAYQRAKIQTQDTLLVPTKKETDKFVRFITGYHTQWNQDFVVDVVNVVDVWNRVMHFPNSILSGIDSLWFGASAIPYVTDLYTSIPHIEGIKSVRTLLTSSKMDPVQINLCCDLLSIILTKNFFLFEDQFFLQTRGTAMGSNAAPPYANCYMAEYEESAIYTNCLFKTHAVMWKRYIDDIFCIWDGPEETLKTFFLFLKTSWPGLDFTITYNQKEVNFLDTLVCKNDQGELSTDLFTKPTDRNSLLHYHSFHPTRMKNAIPKSQFKRVHRIVSDKTRQTQRLDEMRSKFLERGYPPQTLNTSETISTTRTSSKDRIPFVHDYHPLSYILHRSIRRYWHILGTAHPRIKEFKEPFLPCFRRPRNIRDKLVRADIGTTQQMSTQRFLTNPKYGTFPCLQCTQCNNVTRGSTFYHPHNGKQYNIKGYFTCDTSFVVYLIKCPCGLCYIGETTQPIKDRISKHKSTIRCKNTLLPIPHHFAAQGHTVAQLKFQL